ncbi:D-alanyl-D-alanine endopeptidase [Photobacterium sp. BZF1]|uniref:D-alanyl-D-alanine endopeptidase n=1 Tax=Photobacterium sp. BZF1 TaxID=1904457 RepID=UPI00351C9ABC
MVLFRQLNRLFAICLAMSISTVHASKLNTDNIQTASVSTYVTDLDTNKTLFQKNADIVMPIASLTKVMTAMVVLDAKLPLDKSISFEKIDKERIYNGYSRIRMGSTLSRGEALHIALMSSENLATAALARQYPGGYEAFIEAMNAKAKSLGMKDTVFVDSSGLDHNNVSTAADITKMVKAAYKYPKIKEYSTTPVHTAYFKKPRYKLGYTNTNALVRGQKWNVGLSKTGYLDIAGHCLAMVTHVEGRQLLIVTLDAYGKLTPVGDAGRIKKWLQSGNSGKVSESAMHYQKQKLSTLTN